MSYYDLTDEEKKKAKHYYWKFVVFYDVSPRNVQERLKNSALPTNTDEAALIYLYSQVINKDVYVKVI